MFYICLASAQSDIRKDSDVIHVLDWASAMNREKLAVDKIVMYFKRQKEKKKRKKNNKKKNNNNMIS